MNHPVLLNVILYSVHLKNSPYYLTEYQEPLLLSEEGQILNTFRTIHKS